MSCDTFKFQLIQPGDGLGFADIKMDRIRPDWKESQAHRVHTGVHSIMMEKSTRPDEGGRCKPTPVHYVYHHVQSCSVRSSWEGRYTPPISTLPPYVLCGRTWY